MTSETTTIANAAALTDVIMKKYIAGWPISGPTNCAYSVADIGGNIRAKVTITGSGAGGLAAGSYYLVNGVITAIT